jgi:hypothetical protein
VKRAACLALLAAGCNQLLGVTDPHLHDGSDDAGLPGPGSDGGACAGAGFGYTISNLAPCDVPAATAGFLLVNSTIDTTAGTMTVGTAVQPLPANAVVTQLGGDPQVRVISVTALDVPPGITVNVVGQYGLVLVVRGDVEIDGQLLASANHRAPAAGSRSAAACGASAGVVGTAGSIFLPGDASGGSGGGGHGSNGAPGGNGGGVKGGVIPGGAGGGPDNNLVLRPLRGGCPGGVGSGMPAAGGGAIQISASGHINISGTIAAGGGGAAAVDTTVSAPAGGSGGGILLEAGTVAMTSGAAVTANGGAGADGGDTAAVCSGENGHPSNATPAAGGSCSADITGGAGGTGTAPAHGGDTGMRGTGGGGGVGRIAIHSHVFTRGTAAVVSPPANLESF